jgi:methylmalonyl-CoA/ethylmalonyl-CoA epimerase
VKHPVRENSRTTELHFCIVTDDIERTGRWLSELLGTPMPVIEMGPRPELHQEYEGGPVDSDFRQAYFAWRRVGIELIEPGSQASSWRSFLEVHGTGIHHVGVRGRDADATGAELTKMGYSVLHSGGSGGGSFAYYDTTKELGVLLELVTFVEG